MSRRILAMSLAMCALALAAEGFKGRFFHQDWGTGGWDYVAVDANANRVYASHRTAVEVVDTKAGKVVGQITQLHGVHGIAVAPEFGKGIYHAEWSVEQCHHFRSKDAGEGRRAANRAEPGLGLLRT